MLVLPAPAKLNLFLHVTGKRPDGYHTLQTIFQLIDLSDMLSFSRRDDAQICLQTEFKGSAHDDNLIVRAARLLQKAVGAPFGADILLEKHIPVGAGLGGGSSDAATTLLGLNALWGCGLSMDRLAEVGVQLGADVSVFIRGRTAWAEGIGERLTPVDLPEPWYLVVVPPCFVSTREIFSHPQLTRHTPPITISSYHQGHVRNDCEKVVCQLYPEVAKALEWLSAFALARMTGTGCAVFAPMETEQVARRIAEQRPDGHEVIVVKGQQRSPINDMLTIEQQ